MRHRRFLLALSLVVLAAVTQCGCSGNRAHRDDAAKMAANLYACGDALMRGGDPSRIGIAVRLYAMKFAETHGYAIDGADAWRKSLEAK
jgi:hypothetical protein